MGQGNLPDPSLHRHADRRAGKPGVGGRGPRKEADNDQGKKFLEAQGDGGEDDPHARGGLLHTHQQGEEVQMGFHKGGRGEDQHPLPGCKISQTAQAAGHKERKPAHMAPYIRELPDDGLGKHKGGPEAPRPQVHKDDGNLLTPHRQASLSRGKDAPGRKFWAQFGHNLGTAAGFGNTGIHASC